LISNQSAGGFGNGNARLYGPLFAQEIIPQIYKYFNDSGRTYNYLDNVNDMKN
jgi:hypothetical protein